MVRFFIASNLLIVHSIVDQERGHVDEVRRQLAPLQAGLVELNFSKLEV